MPPPKEQSLSHSFHENSKIILSSFQWCGKIPLTCPQIGMSSYLIHKKMAHVKLAIKDLLTFCRLVFSSMNTYSKDFAASLEVMRTCNGFESMRTMTSSWMRTCFWNACLDLLAMDKEDDLRVLSLDASKD